MASDGTEQENVVFQIDTTQRANENNANTPNAVNTFVNDSDLHLSEELGAENVLEEDENGFDYGHSSFNTGSY